MADHPQWLTVEQRDAPLIVSFPHTGTEIPPEIAARCVSPWLARKDADWWIDTLYGFVRELGATTIHTAISRTVIDVNRDPSGVSLYPGQNTTELVPSTTFDGEALWQPGMTPDPTEIARRIATYFDPYHAALAAEIARLRDRHPRVALYD
ncbi:MAG TPA: N-formylglutamate amidohydrolase, partial [Hyphomicrobiaceae bacterium]|nr:N-formylglutamate amidohydrolase [Hyphomicrobiaceae bacterium]